MLGIERKAGRSGLISPMFLPERPIRVCPSLELISERSATYMLLLLLLVLSLLLFLVWLFFLYLCFWEVTAEWPCRPCFSCHKTHTHIFHHMPRITWCSTMDRQSNTPPSAWLLSSSSSPFVSHLLNSLRRIAGHFLNARVFANVESLTLSPLKVFFFLFFFFWVFTFLHSMKTSLADRNIRVIWSGLKRAQLRAKGQGRRVPESWC